MTDRPGSGKLPFVSVAVPICNGEDMIGECIEVLLDQDFPKDLYEAIAVDNDSTDGIAAVIGRYPVLYILEDEILGRGGARNAGAIVAVR
jgi:glycosyltransferase involved in cell wall biosynthesis